MLTEIKQAIALVEQGEVDSGISKLKRLSEKATHEEKFSIAETFLNWGLPEEAKGIVEELLFLYPDEGSLYLLAAEIYIDLEQEEQAIDHLMEIKEDDSSYVQALILMADLYQMQGLDEVAELKLLEAKKRMPAEHLIDYGLAEFYFSKGDYRKSIPYYKAVARKEEKVGERNIYLSLAEATSLTGNFEDALSYYEKGSASDRLDPHTLFGYGFTAYQLERFELAIGKWEELKELDSDYPALFLYLARAYEEEGAMDEAYDTAQEGLKVDEWNKELHYHCGILAMKRKDTQAAETHLKDSITLDPGYIEAVTTLSRLYIAEELYSDAIECIEHSKEYGEHDPKYDWDLAIAKKGLEKYSEALMHYHDAYNAFKDDIEFLEEYGFFLLEEGNRKEAQKVFKKLVELDPTLTHIEEELNRLEDW